MGMINLSVEPLSQQSIVAVGLGVVMPLMVIVSPWIVYSAPMLSIADSVAWISLEKDTPLTTDTPPLKDAQIISLCAKLLDEGISTVPLNFEGVMLTFISSINLLYLYIIITLL
jgi:hypothetical protein